LQRHLSAAETTFAASADEVRRNAAERYLRNTSMTLSHLTRERGYAEQSVLDRVAGGSVPARRITGRRFARGWRASSTT